MARPKKKTGGTVPALFPRGAKGNLYFRLFENGRDRWVSTRTPDGREAAKVRDAILAGKGYGQSIARDERSSAKLARNVAEVIVEGITGKEDRRTPIAGGLEKWISTTPEFSDLTEPAQRYHGTVYRKFAKWCEEAGFESVEDVSLEVARRYAKHLRDVSLSPRTFNGHISCLSKIFDSLDQLGRLPSRNPFNRRIVKRQKLKGAATISKQVLEPEDLKKVIAEAAKAGPDFRDLILIGANTGLRLKDAVLLRWVSLDGGFIELKPYKTLRSGCTARIPVNKVLRAILDARSSAADKNEYVLPALAQHHLDNEHFVGKNVQLIFDNALGVDRTRIDGGKHRSRKACVYGFHSFRVTFMSLLAAKNVSTRDAMRIMAWESPEMVQHYEREMKKSRGDADDRAMKAVEGIEELKLEIPKCPRTLVPTEAGLRWLVGKLSNETIGQVYGMSGSAIHKWLVKFGIKRSGRVMSGKLDDEALQEIREALLG